MSHAKAKTISRTFSADTSSSIAPAREGPSHIDLDSCICALCKQAKLVNPQRALRSPLRRGCVGQLDTWTLKHFQGRLSFFCVCLFNLVVCLCCLLFPVFLPLRFLAFQSSLSFDFVQPSLLFTRSSLSLIPSLVVHRTPISSITRSRLPPTSPQASGLLECTCTLHGVPPTRVLDLRHRHRLRTFLVRFSLMYVPINITPSSTACR